MRCASDLSGMVKQADAELLQQLLMLRERYVIHMWRRHYVLWVRVQGFITDRLCCSLYRHVFICVTPLGPTTTSKKRLTSRTADRSAYKILHTQRGRQCEKSTNIDDFFFPKRRLFEFPFALRPMGLIRAKSCAGYDSPISLSVSKMFTYMVNRDPHKILRDDIPPPGQFPLRNDWLRIRPSV